MITYRSALLVELHVNRTKATQIRALPKQNLSRHTPKEQGNMTVGGEQFLPRDSETLLSSSTPSAAAEWGLFLITLPSSQDY